MKLEFFWQILKNTQLSNFIKICPVVAKLYLTDGWTDKQMNRHDETNICILQFCNEPKKNALHRDHVRPSVLWPGMSNWTIHWIFVKFGIKNPVEKVIDQAPVLWKSTQWLTNITCRSPWISTNICHIYCLILVKFNIEALQGSIAEQLWI